MSDSEVSLLANPALVVDLHHHLTTRALPAVVMFISTVAARCLVIVNPKLLIR